MVIWKLPRPSVERPAGLKYRLHFGDMHGNCFIRYDNEQGKGDHRHYGKTEEAYTIFTIENLISDFLADVSKFSPCGGVT